MLELTGFSLATFGALLAGIIVHALKQFRTARANKADLTAGGYFGKNWPETVIAGLSAIVLWVGLPEIAATFPELAEQIGLGGDVGVVSSFACGFVANSLADLVGGRARSVTLGG